MRNESRYDDSYCLVRMSKGDEEAFTIIFKRYRNRLFSYLFKIIKSKESAEEIVLDVFLKLWAGRTKLPDISNLEQYLFTVAYHKAIDFIRAAKRSPELQTEIWNRIREIMEDEKEEKSYLSSSREHYILKAAGQLTPQRQKVFYLRHKDGLSYQEIAEQLNLSTHTVRNHLAASLQFIKDYITAHEMLILAIVPLLQMPFH